MVDQVSTRAFGYRECYLRARPEVHKNTRRGAHIYSVEPRCGNMAVSFLLSVANTGSIGLEDLSHVLQRCSPSPIFRVTVFRYVRVGRQTEHAELRGGLACKVKAEVPKDDD